MSSLVLRMRWVLISILIPAFGYSQELFTVTEPASNRPAGSIGIRVDNSLMDESNTSKINYHLIPGVMVGVSKKLTLEANIFVSNRSDSFKKEGYSLYAKYRFLSLDENQAHFRMAVFARLSSNNSDIHQEEIELYGHNTGGEVGIVATKLSRRVALSSGISYVQARDNSNGNKFIYGDANKKAINYTLSFGKLMLPREYKDYNQTNVNGMIELISQVNTGSGKYYIDIVPVVQLIINSQSRFDLGYRKQLISTLNRTASNGFFIRLEHTFFNIF